MSGVTNLEQQRTRVYFDTTSRAQIIEKTNKSYISKQNTDVEVVENGLILPITYSEGDMKIGVFDEEGKMLEGSGRWGIGNDLWCRDEDALYLDKTAVYLGPLHYHYGHFLVESTARLWYWLERISLPSEVVPVFSAPVTEMQRIPSFVTEFLHLCGISIDKVCLITKPTRFSKVVVPRVSFNGSTYTERFLLPFIKASESIPPSQHEKVYLTRRKYTKMRSMVMWGEKELEKEFVSNGFMPISMETLSLREQISVMKGARVVAGINGTAMHNVLFGSNIKEVILLNRSHAVDLQYVINDAIQAKCYLCEAYVSILPSPGAAHFGGPFYVGMTPWVRQFFREYGLTACTGEINMKKYLRGYLRSYREVFRVRELQVDRKGVQISAADLEHYFKLCDYVWATPFRMFMLRLLSHTTWGSFGQYIRSRYRYYRSLRRYPILRERGED